MPRHAFMIALALLVTAACSDGGGDSPPGAPPQARTATPAGPGDAVYAADDVGVLEDLACVEGTITVAASQRTFTAPLSCDLMPPADVIARFHGQEIEVEINAGDPSKLYLRSESAGSLEFTVGTVRVTEP
jgi:hypothetical protein